MKRKIVLVTLGSKGDFLPFVGIAKSLKQRGFDPVILSCEPYREIAVREGIRFEAFMSKEDFQKLDSPLLWKPIRGLNFYLKHFAAGTAPAIFEAVARHAELGAVAVVTNHMLTGSYIAAEKFSLPIISVFMQPYSHVSAEDPGKISPAVDRMLQAIGPRGRRWLSNRIVRLMQSRISPVNGLRKQLGLKPWHNFFSETRYSTDLVLGLWPDWFCPKKADWPAICQTTGFVDCGFAERPNASLEVADFFEQEPLVFVMGSEMTQNFEENVRIFRETCYFLGKKGVFVTPVIQGEGFRKIDDNFMLLERASFKEIFPKASCIVTHGGIGTLAIAIGSGRPIVSVPMAYDQFDNAHQLERMKAGATLARENLTAKNLIHAISQAYSNQAPMLRHRMRLERGADSAAQLIERYLQSKPALMEGLENRLSL